ncbi:MAG: LPS assembly lipoprotein LptE [Formosimonas sp.]|jgi:LPS-assembly lipoprotein
MPIFKHLTIALCAIALTACGFHLRGSQGASTATVLSYQTLSIVGDTQSSIGVNLANLMRGQVHVVTAPAPAQVTTEIGEVNHSRTTATKNAQGRITEYRVYASVSVQAYDVNKNQLLAPTRLTISRLLSAGDGYVTSLELEEARLIDVMDLELANQIQYRLRAIKLAK